MPETLETLLVKKLGREDANLVFMQAQKVPPNEREALILDVLLLLEGESTRLLQAATYRYTPVEPGVFLTDPFYLGKADEVYPEVYREFCILNSGRYDEAVLTGGIGSAKTTLALYTQAYQLYLLSCLHNPQATFGLDTSSEIKIIFQSLRASTARTVDFNRFASLVGHSPYFNEVFPFDRSLVSILKFPHRIEIEPVSGSETASIGQNVIGGIIDEINFMAVIENSKQSVDGGTYNQAVELYNSIARRRKTRFMSTGGGMPGMLCVVSSKRLPGEFTDKKMEEAKTNPRIFVYDKRVWDIKPDAFCGETFPLFIGDGIRRPRVLGPEEKVPDEDRHLIDHVPVEFAQEFTDDITKAVRDIAGHSTLASAPFIPNSEKVLLNFGSVKNVSKTPWVDFTSQKCVLIPSRIRNPDCLRYAHIDLSLTSDSTGVVIGHCSGFVEQGPKKEPKPIIEIDLVLEVRPPRGGEIEFSKIRDILYTLQELGMPIKWVSFDSFQSRDSIQLLRQKGFTTGNLSMDTSRIPYDTLKQALYDCRVRIPTHERLVKELLALEIDYKRNKIDHNAHNSKDISDALAGVVYGLSSRREVWSHYGVPLTEEFTRTVSRKENLVPSKEADTNDA